MPKKKNNNKEKGGIERNSEIKSVKIAGVTYFVGG